uniref:Uncharacterized protein n=1 Tax=Catharus ustulatus TaxID=91951 RepID=A0A8C3UGA6_CATUS
MESSAQGRDGVTAPDHVYKRTGHVALVGIPACALGLTGAGIAAGSIAAKMMSTAAIANGGKAVLQSVGEWGGQGSWASSPWQGTQGCILDLL